MEESVALRRGEPADAEAIRGLVEAAYTQWIPVIGRLPIPMQADYARALQDHRFDLLLAGPDLAGLIETRAETDHLLVVNVAVHPAFQGRGLGTRLMELAEVIAAQTGFNRLRLYTNGKYTANLRLYGFLGYRVEREERYDGPDPGRRRHRAHGEGPGVRGWAASSAVIASVSEATQGSVTSQSVAPSGLLRSARNDGKVPAQDGSRTARSG